MARKAVGERRTRILNHLARMLVRHLMDHAYKDKSVDEVIKRLGLGKSVLNCPWWTDVPEICDAASLDIGLAIRDSKGHEVTLWPAENFSEAFKPSKPARKKLPPALPVVEASHRTGTMPQIAVYHMKKDGKGSQ
jgi:hypothetical protein